MYKEIILNRNLVIALEESEAIYWSKYYANNGSLKCFVNTISGAFVGAVPEVDFLAMNRVIGLGLRKQVKPEHIDDIIRFYQKAGSRRFFIQLSPYTIQDNLAELLRERGFQHHNNWAKLVRSADQPLPEVHSELKVVRVNQSEAHIYGQILFDSFNWEDERLVDWLASTVAKPGYRHYLALRNDLPVAAAALHTAGIYGSMAFAGTKPEHRNLGAQSILLKTRIADAVKLGCKYIIAETAEDKPQRPVASFRNMLRAEFEVVYLRENWIYEF